MDERRWIASVLAGDMQSFACLVAKYEKMAYTIAFRIMGNREEAEEVAQDAFLKMYRALPQFKFESKFSSWFYRIVYRTALTALRGQLVFSDYEEVAVTDISLSEEETAMSLLERKDRKEFISKTLAELPKVEALLLTLYYLEECSVEEICQITDLTASNVKTKLFRARKLFYKTLEKQMKNEMNSLL